MKAGVKGGRIIETPTLTQPGERDPNPTELTGRGWFSSRPPQVHPPITLDEMGLIRTSSVIVSVLRTPCDVWWGITEERTSKYGDPGLYAQTATPSRAAILLKRVIWILQPDRLPLLRLIHTPFLSPSPALGRKDTETGDLPHSRKLFYV